MFDKMVLIGTEGGKIMYYCTETCAVKWETVGHLGNISSLALDKTAAISASTAPDLCEFVVLMNRIVFHNDIANNALSRE